MTFDQRFILSRDLKGQVLFGCWFSSPLINFRCRQVVLLLVMSILCWRNFYAFSHLSQNSLQPIPDGHDGKSKKKPQGATEFSEKGCEGEEKDLLLCLRELGHGPQPVSDLSLDLPTVVRLDLDVEELVLVVLARDVAPCA